MKTPLWITDLKALAHKPSDHIHRWMQAHHISKAIKRVCRQLQLKVIHQGIKYAYEDEYHLLGSPREEVFIRQILLYGDGLPLTFGRVMAPQSTYRLHQQQFDSLGNNLIGETLLHGREDVERSEFEFAHLNHTHALLAEINLALKGEHQFASLWARRSCFQLRGAPLLLTESFLPLLPPYRDE